MQRRLNGSGSVELSAPREILWDALLDPVVLKELMPGAASVERVGADGYRAVLSYGVGRFRSDYTVDLAIDRQVRPSELDLSGNSSGPLGRGTSVAKVTLHATPTGGCVVAWTYEGIVSGAVALAGMRLLNAAAAHFVGQFFRSLSERSARLAA